MKLIFENHLVQLCVFEAENGINHMHDSQVSISAEASFPVDLKWIRMNLPEGEGNDSEFLQWFNGLQKMYSNYLRLTN